MEKLTIPAETRGRYDALAADLVAQDPAVVASQMFGMPTLKSDGKAFAGISGAAMVFKLSGDAHAAALAIPGATLFDPSGMGRPMKAWIIVPADQSRHWPTLAAQALASLRA
jgi:hypothetical protein